MSSDCKKVAAVVFAVLWIPSFIMVGCSFDTLDPLHYGLETNTATKAITEDRVYLNGRYFLGLGRAFLEFPRTYRTITFADGSGDASAITGQSSGGTIRFECSLQYTLNITGLARIYRKYELNYHGKFVNFAQNAITLAAQQFSPSQYYAERAKVQKVFLDAVRAALIPEDVYVHHFQLRKATLPNANEEKVLTAIVSSEGERTANNEQARARIVASTNVIQQTIEADITVYRSRRQSEANLLIAEANAQAKGLRLNAEAGSFLQLRDALNITNDALMHYLWLRNIRNLPSESTLAVGLASGTLQVSG